MEDLECNVQGYIQPPCATHRYILEQVSCVKHIKIRLLNRFRKFKVSLQNSNNKLVSNLLVPENSEWRISLIKDILDVKSKDCHIKCTEDSRTLMDIK